MTLHQIHLFRALVDNDFHLSKTADLMFISQPGLSQQIKLLEESIGESLFLRKGKSIKGLSLIGEGFLKRSNEIIQSLQSFDADLKEFQSPNTGDLKIAVTHTQAKYFLPEKIIEFKKQFPNVELHIEQGNPVEISQMLKDHKVDFAMATEGLKDHKNIVAMPIYKWKRIALSTLDHPLLKSKKKVSLNELSKYPLITYSKGVAGRANMDQSFSDKELSPNIILAAVDSDVIKTYSKLGLGVGVVADMAFDKKIDRGLHKINLEDHSIGFSNNTSYMAYNESFQLRNFHLGFISICASHVDIKKLPLLKRDSSYLADCLRRTPSL
jgi:LysR family cys regulon transcriptional activator